MGVGERSRRLRSLDRERDFESRRLRRLRDVERDLRLSFSALVLSMERLSFDLAAPLSFPSFAVSFVGLFDVDLRLGRRSRSLLDVLLELLEELLDELLLDREPDDEREELLSDELV